jgi:predicted phage-related endonuclease
VTFTICTAEQRSEEWRRARAGRVTGSKAADILATVKSGEAAKRRDYRSQLLAERLTGQPQDDVFVNDAMQWGIDKEADAFAAYEAYSGHLVRRTGFLAVDDQPIGCSLDGDVDDFTGIIELKCPKTATHLGYLRGGIVPPAYVPQIVHNLLVSGAQWCDFASFDPRLPAPLQLFVVRHARDEKQIASYELALSLFLSELEVEVYELRKRMEPVTA